MQYLKNSKFYADEKIMSFEGMWLVTDHVVAFRIKHTCHVLL